MITTQEKLDIALQELLRLRKEGVNRFKVQDVGTPAYYARERERARAIKNERGRISRLKSKLIVEAGPIVHHDCLGQELVEGAMVAWADGGRYAGYRIGVVEKLTPKRIKVRMPKKGEVPDAVTAAVLYRTWGGTTEPKNLIVIDKIMEERA